MKLQWEREIYIDIRKLVPSLAEVLQPFTSKFTTGDVSNSLFLGARWRALAGKTQVTDIITRTNTLTYSQGHLNTMPFGINWDPTHPQQKSGWKISSFNHFWRGTWKDVLLINCGPRWSTNMQASGAPATHFPMPVVCSDDASDTGGPMNSRWNCAVSVSLSPSNALKIESKTLSFSSGGPQKSLEVGSFYGDKALQGTFWCALIISGNKSLAVEHVLWNYVLRHKKQPGMSHSTKASFWPPCILGWRPEGWETCL